MTTDEKLDMLIDLVKDNNERLKANDKRFDDIENLVSANYKMTEEFYVAQKEANSELFDQIAVISGELEMHNNQIARNTADLRRYK
ncbi:hypothetical protein [uncultured Robinsoniella sp.]|uniref:hypothetical protein n=1 Tax=uncultured Robinsoniella sp. TaxID=904190 RepID=UPI00374F9E02